MSLKDWALVFDGLMALTLKGLALYFAYKGEWQLFFLGMIAHSVYCIDVVVAKAFFSDRKESE